MKAVAYFLLAILPVITPAPLPQDTGSPFNPDAELDLDFIRDRRPRNERTPLWT